MRSAFAEVVTELADADPSVWLLTGDLGYSVLEVFATRHPDRFINVGVAEQNMIGVAAGLAQGGKRVFAYSIATFATLRCLEQIRNDVCYPNLSVTVVGVGGGYAYSTQGFTHHATEDFALMRSMPNMIVAAPADGQQVRSILQTLSTRNGPTYLRLEKSGEPILCDSNAKFSPGAAIRMKDGSEVLLIGVGSVTGELLQASRLLRESGIDAAVWMFPFVKPIDTLSLHEAAQKFRLIICVEEHQRCGGMGSAVAEVICELPQRQSRLLCLGADDIFIEKAYSHSRIREELGLDAKSIAARVVDELLI